MWLLISKTFFFNYSKTLIKVLHFLEKGVVKIDVDIIDRINQIELFVVNMKGRDPLATLLSYLTRTHPLNNEQKLLPTRIGKKMSQESQD